MNIIIQIKGNYYFTRISFVEIYREQFLLIQIYDIDVCSLIFVTDKIFGLQEESIKTLQCSSFQWIFNWKWKDAYFCNIHSLTTHFVIGIIGTGYLLFGRNHLVIFIVVSVFYVFSIFYSIFRICIFVAFCCIQSAAFCGFLVPF